MFSGKDPFREIFDAISFEYRNRGLADDRTMAALLGWLAPSESMPVAQVEAERALEIDETLPEAHSALAAVLFRYHYDWERACREYRRALELRPGHGTLRNWYSSFLLFQGHHERALAEARAASALDPLSVEACRLLAGNLYFCGLFDEAIEECERALELDPDYFFGFFFRGLANGIDHGMSLAL